MLQCAKVEAMCAPNGIGFVKVMGRHAGFIAAHAALASGDVDLCLIPEVCACWRLRVIVRMCGWCVRARCCRASEWQHSH